MAEANPLLEAHPLSLDTLFSADPHSLTDKEIQTIVEELQRGRLRLMEAEQAGKTSRATATRAPKEAKPAKGTLTLDSLGDLEF